MKKLIIVSLALTTLISCDKDKKIEVDYSKGQTYKIECDCNREVSSFRYDIVYDVFENNSVFEDYENETNNYIVSEQILHEGFNKLDVRIIHHSVDVVPPNGNPIPQVEFSCNTKVTIGDVIVLDTTQSEMTLSENGTAGFNYYIEK